MNEPAPAKVHPAIEKLASDWRLVLERARVFKDEVFGRQARECLGWYSGPKSWDDLMGKESTAAEDYPDVMFRMHINKAFEYVKIFGPSLYYTNPVRTVKPRAPVQIPGQYFADPFTFQQLAMQEQMRVAIDGARAILLGGYLNWTPSRYQLDVESRLAIDEALIKGRGVLWTQLVESPDGAFKSVVSEFDSINHLLVDPDGTSVGRCKWVARESIQPVWQVERDYGLRPGTLKGNLESLTVQASIADDPFVSYRRNAGMTQDLIRIWQIWSKMGIGGRLPTGSVNLRRPLDEIFGDYAYLVITDNCRYPLNLPPDLVNDPNRYDDTLRAAEWPIPFWQGNKWPFTELDFNAIFELPWPMATLMAAKGELRFLNWVFSFLAGHLHNACRDFVAVKKSLPEELKQAILSGRDLQLIELDHEHGVIADAIQFLQHPQVNGDIWQYIEAVQDAFDKRVGLSELLYGGAPPTQPRSAAESNIRNQTTGIRPDDMAQQVESWQTEVAAKEAFCARYLLRGQDVQVCMGPLAAMAWDTYVFTADPAEAFHALEYRIEAGTTRKPNREYEVNQMTEAAQVLLPVFQAYAQATGDMSPLNNLIADFCKSRDLDPNRYQLLAAPAAPLLPSSASGQPTPSQGGASVPPASGQPELG